MSLQPRAPSVVLWPSCVSLRYSFYKDLLNTTYEAPSVLGFGIIPANKTQRILASMEQYCSGRRQTIEKNEHVC